MSNESQNCGALLQEIHPALRTPEQVPLWRHGRESPTHILLRKPVSLQELNQYKYSVSIWRGNGTLTYVTPSDGDDLPDRNQRYLFLEFLDNDDRTLGLYITGGTDDAIADTLDYFVGLHKQEATPVLETELVLAVPEDHHVFHFRNARFQCLRRLSELASSYYVRFHRVMLNAEQTRALATLPDPIEVYLRGCQFEDLGTTFVIALEDRQSSFGMLHFDETTPLDDDNLKRLLQVDKIDWLQLPKLNNELALLPFSAKAQALEYHIASTLLPEVTYLNVVSSRLSLHVDHNHGTFPAEEVISFVQHAANLGHFVDLAIAFPFLNGDWIYPSVLCKNLLRPQLQTLTWRFLVWLVLMMNQVGEMLSEHFLRSS